MCRSYSYKFIGYQFCWLREPPFGWEFLACLAGASYVECISDNSWLEETLVHGLRCEGPGFRNFYLTNETKVNFTSVYHLLSNKVIDRATKRYLPSSKRYCSTTKERQMDWPATWSPLGTQHQRLGLLAKHLSRSCIGKKQWSHGWSNTKHWMYSIQERDKSTSVRGLPWSKDLKPLIWELFLSLP